MAARIWGGIAGWFFGLLPLVAVNAANNFGVFSYAEQVPAGALGLLAGIVLGGMAAGMIGGRVRKGRMGGVPTASVSGGLAAMLYIVTVIGLVIGTGIGESAPSVLATNPIQFSIAVVFFASLLLGVALIAGAFAGRGAPTTAGIQQQPGTSRPNTATGLPRRARGGYGAEASHPQPRHDEGVRAVRWYDDRRDGRYAGDGDYSNEYGRDDQRMPYPAEPRYAGTRPYDRQSRPARRPGTGPSSR